jgi:hypothetical protein
LLVVAHRAVLGHGVLLSTTTAFPSEGASASSQTQSGRGGSRIEDTPHLLTSRSICDSNLWPSNHCNTSSTFVVAPPSLPMPLAEVPIVLIVATVGCAIHPKHSLTLIEADLAPSGGGC